MANPPNRPFTKFAFDTSFFEVVGAPSGGAQGTSSPTRTGPRTFDEARQEGYTEGYATGLQDGQKQADQSLAKLHETLHATLTGLEEALALRETQLLVQTLSLVRLTLHHVLGHAAVHYPDELLEHHLKSVLPLVKTDESLELRINPVAQGFHEKLKMPQASIMGLPMHIKQDPSLAPTDVNVSWKSGGVESKLAAHWENINALLLGAGASNLPVPPLPTHVEANPAPASTSGPSAPQQPEAVSPLRARAAELLGDDDDLVDALK